MNLVVVTREEFPFGGAGTNRMLTYLPGIVALGHNVTVLCLFLSNKENAKLLDKNGECIYDGVRIKYVAGSKPWPIGEKKYFTKAYLAYKSRKKAYSFLKTNRNNIDIVQLYSIDIKTFERYNKICRKLGLKYIIERSELPDIVKNSDKYNATASGKRYIRRSEKSFGLFDGWILETQTLLDYYSQFFSPNVKCVIVPMTVDVERFSQAKSANPRFGKYIAYCGNMSEVDGISILIKAYAIVHKKYNDIKLVLAGESSDVLLQQQLAKSLGLKDDIIFLGKISRDEVPQFLTDATMLVLASPTSDRSCATMPCKVGEYLCTANPVVVTGLGEINKYLKDGESAFLSKPDSSEEFALKMEEVLENINKANEVGLRGKMVAIENFSTNAQVLRIEMFYKELI